MQSKAKVNSVVTHSVNEETGVLTFTVRGVGSFEFDPFKTHADVQNRAAMHGFIQRISDGAALSRDPETGLPATAQAKFDRMVRIRDHYESGTAEWALRVASGDAPAGLIIQAMIEAGLAADVDAADDIVAKTCVTKEIERKAALALWAKTDRVGEAIVAIKARRDAAAPKVSADELMAQLVG